MAESSSDRTATAEREVVIRRVIAAPRERVFEAWTDPAHFKHWWHPDGFRSVDCEQFELRVGGGFGFRMVMDDGSVYTSTNVYREIVAPSRLVWDEVCLERGNPFHRARWQVDFEEHEAGTLLIIRALLEWVEGRDPRWTPELMKQGLAKGVNDNLDKLEAYLAALG
jgi:uncharacterized protein YndB with AHSA1/START domain